MALPSISVVKFAPELSDEDVQATIRAVNRQVVEDFVPIWGTGGALRLHAPVFDPADPQTLQEEPIRGEGAVYLVDEATLPGALGYHDMNGRGMPVGFVFVLDPEDWTVTLSHEVLELLVDPIVNIFVPGPDPRDASNLVLHTYEVCDAVERTAYDIDGILVSNFVTPNYFTEREEIGSRNDFLGIGVDSFGVTAGSHIAFFDLRTWSFNTVIGEARPQPRQFAERARLYDHPKPKRPPDDRLMGMLTAYQKSPEVILGEGLQLAGLPTMIGVTRTSRYQAASEQLRGPKG